jgi:hypothetical protein
MTTAKNFRQTTATPQNQRNQSQSKVEECRPASKPRLGNARPPLNFKLSFPCRDAPHRIHLAKIETQNTNHPKRGTGAEPEKEGEHRHFDSRPRRRLQHRRILAFVPTNSPRPRHPRRKHNIVLEGAVEKGATKDCPPTENSTSSSPKSPDKPCHHDSTAGRSSRRAPRRRVSSAVDPRSTSIRRVCH